MADLFAYASKNDEYDASNIEVLEGFRASTPPSRYVYWRHR